MLSLLCQFGAFLFGARQFGACQFGAFHFDAFHFGAFHFGAFPMFVSMLIQYSRQFSLFSAKASLARVAYLFVRMFPFYGHCFRPTARCFVLLLVALPLAN